MAADTAPVPVRPFASAATIMRLAGVTKTETVPAANAFVQPSELCDTQRRSMGYDAFAALQSQGF